MSLDNDVDDDGDVGSDTQVSKNESDKASKVWQKKQRLDYSRETDCYDKIKTISKLQVQESSKKGY